MNKTIFELKDISYTYKDGTRAIENIDLSIAKGEKLFVHGANGVGKTTLFQCMNGLLKPNKGEIYLRGEKVKSQKQLMQSVGIVFQNTDDQIIASSVYEEISFGAMNMGWGEDYVKEKVEQMIVQLQLEEIRNKPPHFLSYGQKKRVCIAAVLAMEPQILILDEPFASLDPVQTEKTLELFNSLAQTGVTLIIACHDVNITWKTADKVVVLHDRKVYDYGTTQNILANNSLLEMVKLEKPFVVETYEKLVEYGIINAVETLPRTKDELYKLIKKGRNF